MNSTKLQSRLAFAAGELTREAQRWRSTTRQRLLRDARQAMAASASIHQTTARDRRAAEALLEAALETLVRHALVRLEMELEQTR